MLGYLSADFICLRSEQFSTERLSSFIDRLLQPIAHKQKSYRKDATDFTKITETIIVPGNAICISMDVTSLYTNLPQEEGIETV